MMKIIVDEDLVDHDYVRHHTIGFDKLVDRLRSLSLQDLARDCDIPLSKIQDLAREYAGTRPAAMRIGFGVQRNGGASPPSVPLPASPPSPGHGATSAAASTPRAARCSAPTTPIAPPAWTSLRPAPASST